MSDQKVPVLRARIAALGVPLLECPRHIRNKQTISVVAGAHGVCAGSCGQRRHKIHIVLSAPAWVVATDSRAACKAGGRTFPRRSARRSIPIAAFWLKKYRSGTGGVSKTSDNEHTAAALGHSEVLSVKNPPGNAIPEFDQPSKDDGKVASFVAGEKARNVLNENPTGNEFSNGTTELMPKSAPLSSQPSTFASHAEVLAGKPSANKVNWGKVGLPNCSDIRAEVGVSVGVRTEAGSEDLPTWFIDFDLPCNCVPGPGESEVKASDSAEE